MANGSYIWKLKNSGWCLCWLCFVSCSQSPQTIINTEPYSLQSGDLVCRLGNGYFSNYFRQYASKDQKYSHIGMIEVNHDSVFVIHTEASELTGVGFVKKESLTYFLEGISVFDFYRINANDTLKNKIIQKANNYYAKKIPFDLDFNSLEDDELYCTELVARCLNDAFDSAVVQPKLKLGHRMMYGLDDIYKHPMIQKIKKTSANDTLSDVK